MKRLFALLIGVLVTSALSAQTYVIDGTIKHTDGPTLVTVYEFDGYGNWNEVTTKKERDTYILALEADRDYQVWFTDKSGFTKVLAVNRGVMNVPEFRIDVDFSQNESAQIDRDSAGAYVITIIDTDFTVLRTPFDLYPLVPERQSVSL